MTQESPSTLEVHRLNLHQQQRPDWGCCLRFTTNFVHHVNQRLLLACRRCWQRKVVWPCSSHSLQREDCVYVCVCVMSCSTVRLIYFRGSVSGFCRQNWIYILSFQSLRLPTACDWWVVCLMPLRSKPLFAVWVYFRGQSHCCSPFRSKQILANAPGDDWWRKCSRWRYSTRLNAETQRLGTISPFTGFACCRKIPLA